jgi:hypothetical protein
MERPARRLGLWALIACTSALPLCGADGAASADLDTQAAVALAESIPLLTLNLNNYKHPANPVLTAGEKGQWDAAGIERVAVIRLGQEDWRMWYACTGARRSLGLATSKDGVHWTKHPGNPVLQPTEPWEEGYLSPTSVLQVNGKFYLYYWGPSHVFPDRVTGKLPPPKMKYIGLVTSEDGIHWTRQGEVDGRQGAVLGPEPPGINEHAAAGGSGVDAAKVEADEEWFHVYYSTGQQSLGLIRAPKRSVHQPIVLWEKQVVEPAGLQSMILEPDRLPFTLHLTSDQDGELRLVAWNPAAQDWLELNPTPVRAGVLCSIAPLPAHAKLRLKFTPGEARATVSAWVVPQ